jgi:DNA-directed RNA polymerase specialized sigma subunit
MTNKEIINLYKTGKVTQQQIANMAGVTKARINQIIKELMTPHEVREVKKLLIDKDI